MVTKYDHGHIIFQAVYIQTISIPSGVFKPYAFTFQSGYIQIIILKKSLRLLKVYFTFQSGYIQISIKLKCYDDDRPLHSNLVIFKSESYNTIYSRHFKPHFLSTRIFTSTELLWRVYFITIKYPFTFIL